MQTSHLSIKTICSLPQSRETIPLKDWVMVESQYLAAAGTAFFLLRSSKII
jgi:hypothetical protein